MSYNNKISKNKPSFILTMRYLNKIENLENALASIGFILTMRYLNQDKTGYYYLYEEKFYINYEVFKSFI